MNRIEKSPDCLSLEQLAEFAGKQLPPGRHRRFQEHLRNCPACRTELALLQEFEQPSLTIDEESDVEWIAARLKSPAQLAQEAGASSTTAQPSSQESRDAAGADAPVRRRTPAAAPDRVAPPRRGFWQRLLQIPALPAAGLAASLLLAAVALFLIMQRPGEVSLGPAGGDLLRSEVIALRQPLGLLTSPPQTLAWEEVQGASSYRVVILTVDRSPLWQQETEAVSAQIPQQIRGEMSPSRRFLWQVTAYSPQGERLAASEVASFRVQAR